MHQDFFSATFYAMMNKNKKEFKLLTQDQADYFFESFFIISIQFILCIAIWSQRIDVVFVKPFEVNLAMFFTNLVLHFSSIATVRNGIQMCKYVVYHSDQFQNPNAAFFLGVMLAIANMFCSVTNMYQTLQQSTVVAVIQKFVGFKILIQIQDYYLKSRSNFEIKRVVTKQPLKIKPDPKNV